MAKEFIRRSSVVTVDGSLDMIRKAIASAISFDAYGQRTTFPALIISPVKEMTVTEAGFMGAATKMNIGQQAKSRNYMFKVRILGNNSPHQYLPDPTDPAFNTSSAANKDKDKRCALDPLTIVNLHTTVVLLTSGDAPAISMGDIVEVRLSRDGAKGALNMQFGSFVQKVAGPGQGGTNFTRNTGYVIAGNFDYLQQIHGESGAKDDPTFGKCDPSIYPELEKRPMRFFRSNAQETQAAVRATMSNNNVGIVMWAFINHEQPNFKFPAWNVAGIQLDNKGVAFAGSTRADFDYQSCFRDNGGEMRIFAGFNDLERGMSAYEKIIKAKVKTPFKKLSKDNVDAAAETLTWNYYRSWNLALSKKELLELKTTGKVIRDGKVIERDWNKSKEKFKNALQDWGWGKGVPVSVSEEEMREMLGY